MTVTAAPPKKETYTPFAGQRPACRTLLGGSEITLEYSPLRISPANNLESVLAYEGASEIHMLSIGRALTGHAAFR